MWLVQPDSTTVASVEINQIKCGDEILALSESGNIVKKPVISVNHHPAMLNKFIDITLCSGRVVTPTWNHYMPIFENGRSQLRLAQDVKQGDIF